MTEQFHFDPDTYLDMVRSEVPDYEQLQNIVAEAAGEVVANSVLEQLQWMADAQLTATLRWTRHDLAVLVGDRA